MRRIKNPWTGKKNYFCFGCCPDNPIGMHMTFYADGDDIVCVWKPRKELQGWIDTLHGGIQAVLLDEICAWAVMLKVQTSGVTVKMETRYKHSVATNEGPIVLRSHVTEIKRNIVTIETSITDCHGKICTQATCTYFTFSEEKSKEMGFESCEMIGEEVTLEEVLQALNA